MGVAYFNILYPQTLFPYIKGLGLRDISSSAYNEKPLKPQAPNLELVSPNVHPEPDVGGRRGLRRVFARFFEKVEFMGFMGSGLRVWDVRTLHYIHPKSLSPSNILDRKDAPEDPTPYEEQVLEEQANQQIARGFGAVAASVLKV